MGCIEVKEPKRVVSFDHREREAIRSSIPERVHISESRRLDISFICSVLGVPPTPNGKRTERKAVSIPCQKRVLGRHGYDVEELR